MISVLQVGYRWWSTWQTRSVNRRVFAAMFTVGGMTAMVKLLAVIKDMVVASQFGASDAMDAFLIALFLPQFALHVIGGSLNAALIPVYVQVRENEGIAAAQRMLSSVMTITCGCLLVGSCLLALTTYYALPLVASGFAPDKLALAHSIFDLLLILLLLNGVSTIWGAILNAHNRFALAAAVPMVTSILTVLLVWTLARPWGIYSMVAATVAGAVIEAAVLGWGVAREGVAILPRWDGMVPGVRQVLSQYVPMIAGAFLMMSAGLVSQSMAAMLGPGSVSALAYGSKVASLLLGVGALAVSTAVLPHFSQMVATANWTELRRTLSTYVRLMILVGLPATLLCLYFSDLIVALLFQRGAFTEADTRLVSRVQMAYLLHVPLYIVAILFVKLISALQANHILMWGALLNLIANIMLTYVLMQWLGVVGIALAISVMYWLSAGYLAVMCYRVLKSMDASPAGVAAPVV